MNKSAGCHALFYLMACLAILSRAGLAQDNPDSQDEEEMGKPYGQGTHAAVEVPPGMEEVNVGGIRMIIPQGTKVEKKGSLLVMENTDEFVARNFKEIRELFARTESRQDDLQKALEDLRLEVSDLRKKVASDTR